MIDRDSKLDFHEGVALSYCIQYSCSSQALEASICRYTPFCSVPFCALSDGNAYTGNAASSMLHGRAVLLRPSLASQPTFFRSKHSFQYRHAEEWSGDLGPLHVKPLERNN